MAIKFTASAAQGFWVKDLNPRYFVDGDIGGIFKCVSELTGLSKHNIVITMERGEILVKHNFMIIGKITQSINST